MSLQIGNVSKYAGTLSLQQTILILMIVTDKANGDCNAQTSLDIEAARRTTKLNIAAVRALLHGENGLTLALFLLYLKWTEKWLLQVVRTYGKHERES